jgi:hypothetical protein
MTARRDDDGNDVGQSPDDFLCALLRVDQHQGTVQGIDVSVPIPFGVRLDCAVPEFKSQTIGQLCGAKQYESGSGCCSLRCTHAGLLDSVIRRFLKPATIPDRLAKFID